MTKQPRWIAAICGAVLLLCTHTVHAITQVSGMIETAPSLATVDLWFFTLDVTSAIQIQMDPIAQADPLSVEHTSILLYKEDGAGGLGSFLGSAGIGGPVHSNAQIEFPAATPLLSGDYVVVASAFPLTPGEFGPTQSDPENTLSFLYELTLTGPGGNESSFTCSITGNLNGTFTRTTTGGDCQIPTTVPEPGTLATFALGLTLLGMVRRRRALID